jgi:hypothetical protein
MPRCDVAAERRRQDLTRLQAQCAGSNGRLLLVGSEGEPVHSMTVELVCRTAGGADFPARSLDRVRATIHLPARYPFQEPRVELRPAVFHPNVYASGRVCLGWKWLPTEGLDLLIKRVAQIVTFDPAVVNMSSPANPAAATWYSHAIQRHPRSFPTENLEAVFMSAAAPKGQWRDLSAAPAATADRMLPCGGCGRMLRVRATAGLRVRCPACSHIFQL